MSYTLSTTNITTNSATIVFTMTSEYESSETVALVITKGSETVATESVTIAPGAATGDTLSVPINGLRSNTEYVATSGSETTMFTTLEDTTPKTATVSQWEDLADKIKTLESRVAALEGN